MRRIREAVLPFIGNNDDRLPKTVREYRQKYKGVSQILEAHSLRETVVRIAESDFLQDFLRTRKKAVMDIHWPTDAWLLWDTWRVAARLLRQGRAIAPDTCLHRFHGRKTKRLGYE